MSQYRDLKVISQSEVLTGDPLEWDVMRALHFGPFSQSYIHSFIHLTNLLNRDVV